MLSKELQIGKVGEHLVCADLILRGYNAFLSDQGLPFDVIIEHDGKIKSVQVKTTMGLIKYNNIYVYRFGIRCGKRGSRAIKINSVDYFAFVALDIKSIAYIPSIDIMSNDTHFKQLIELRTLRQDYPVRVYSNGTIQNKKRGSYFEDYSEFVW